MGITTKVRKAFEWIREQTKVKNILNYIRWKSGNGQDSGHLHLARPKDDRWTKLVTELGGDQEWALKVKEDKA